MSDELAERMFEIETPLGTLKCYASHVTVDAYGNPYLLAPDELALVYRPPGVQ